MKRVLVSLSLIAAVSVVSFAEGMNKKAMSNYRAVEAKNAVVLQKGKAKMFCNVCGMTLPMFYKTNHSSTIDDKTHQYCSIHCMHEDSMMKNKKSTNKKVVNNSDLKFINVEDAFYVVGSKKPATMAMTSKYAFGTEEQAKDFQSKFGGKIMRYDVLEKEVTNSMKKEITMIKKRQAKASKMGKKIYMKMCKQTEKRFKSPALAKSFIKQNNLCGNIKGKPFQQVGLYLSNK